MDLTTSARPGMAPRAALAAPVFVINLDGSDARLEAATRQLEAAGLPFERVPAVDGRGRDPSADPAYDPRRAWRFMGRPLQGGEIGCFRSHLAAAERFLQTGAPVGVVFEDDLLLMPGADEGLPALIERLGREPGWDLVNIGPTRLKYASRLGMFDGGFRRFGLVRAHYFPMTTTGLIWSREGARRFLELGRSIHAPVDHALRDWLTRSGRGLAVWPAMVGDIRVESEITPGGAPARRGPGAERSLFYGLIKQRRLIPLKLIALRQRRAFRQAAQASRES
ncbi:glycosyl transferase [Paracoccus sp. S-4012]|uniref:glycosyltransferase family 25 protein n=1 Tax=Paracoccus sp. S-4012 TaxID=2665648 RepID=UPI0012B10CF5|nr:glycosyltransferase family 25 protein [Paracoccus sp. S-4012]MRX49878.1 glycosyl transferase [Paracoccus sp. S-4012]